MIPNVVMQTSRRSLPARIVRRTMSVLGPKFQYVHYDDRAIEKFFSDYPHGELPGVLERFRDLNAGEHKADLFRYYYLYTLGGVYFDTDVLLVSPLAKYLSGRDFVSVRSGAVSNSLFQGFLAAEAGHPVLERAIRDVCNSTNDQLKSDHHLLCKNLDRFLREALSNHDVNPDTVTLFDEVLHSRKVAKSLDAQGRCVLYHFWRREFPPIFPIAYQGAKIAW
ncbi:hypothetical protein HKCCA1058_06045 [Rhodobacterales bacterium HKCCA1058]|nr:hypothetical protein [Rhodobacterales bacterium HKCCA1058]